MSQPMFLWLLRRGVVLECPSVCGSDWTHRSGFGIPLPPEWRSRMRLAPSVLLSKATSARPDKRDQIADHLRRHAVRRLELVAWLTFTIQLVVWLLINLVQGSLAEEFSSPLDWAFPIGVLIASVGVILLTRRYPDRTDTLVRLGLVYQVVVSLGIAAGSYLGAFEGMPGDEITFDRVGLTFVGPWMLVFSVLVPAVPREALIALLVSA